MTSTSIVQKTGNLPGDGSTFTFDFSPLIIYASTDIEVTLTVTATGDETLLTEGTSSTQYAVNVTTFPGVGTITYPADEGTALASTSTITIKPVFPLTQPIDVNGALDEVLERQLDKLTKMMIQQQEEIDRCLKVPISDSTITSTEINSDGLRTATHHVQVSADGTTFTTAALSSGTAATASDATPAAVNLSAGAAGSGANFSRSDHAHLLPTTVPTLAAENTFTETQIWTKGSDLGDGDIASGLLTIGPGNRFDLAGTESLDGIVSVGIGVEILIHFDSARTITHNATNLILPGGVNIVTQAGDIAKFYEYASADWRMSDFIHGTATNGRMPGPDYESAETSLNDSAQITFTHGLGAAPSKIEVVLRANTATSQGWANNEEMIFVGGQAGSTIAKGFDVTADTTTVYITQAASIELFDHTSFALEDITDSQYDWVVRCWK